jgi:hypothetical protein
VYIPRDRSSLSRLFIENCSARSMPSLCEIRKFSSISRFEHESQKKGASMPMPRPRFMPRFIDLSFHQQPCCRPYTAGILHSVSDQIQNLPNCFTTSNKMTSEDDIKGLVSLKFLRPCFKHILFTKQRRL